MEPAVITFRPDNFLTIGLIGAIMFLAAILLVQGAARFGLIKLAPSQAAAPAIAPGTVAAA